jgi:hypothetical protein
LGTLRQFQPDSGGSSLRRSLPSNSGSSVQITPKIIRPERGSLGNSGVIGNSQSNPGTPSTPRIIENFRGRNLLGGSNNIGGGNNTGSGNGNPHVVIPGQQPSGGGNQSLNSGSSGIISGGDSNRFGNGVRQWIDRNRSGAGDPSNPTITEGLSGLRDRLRQGNASGAGSSNNPAIDGSGLRRFLNRPDGASSDNAPNISGNRGLSGLRDRLRQGLGSDNSNPSIGSNQSGGLAGRLRNLNLPGLGEARGWKDKVGGDNNDTPSIDLAARGLRNRLDNARTAFAVRSQNADLPQSRFLERFKSGDLNRLANTGIGKQLNLDRQFSLLHNRGDVAHRLGFGKHLHDRGGWKHRGHRGFVSRNFRNFHFSSWYPGPFWGPSYCWTPYWRPWVSWSWWDYCDPFYDPRPYICRPIIYDPCPVWTAWDYYPTWQPLYTDVAGTWIDVPATVVDSGNDVQLLAVRFVDPGHPEKQLGPRYRIWLRNNGTTPITTPFDVVLLAANAQEPSEGLPDAGVRVETMEVDQTQAVDIRLPFAANTLATDDQGRKVPFKYLHVFVDARRELNDVTPDNNGAVIERSQIQQVDPAIFSADTDVAPSGGLLNIAGEGFGPEPGQVVITVQGLELQAQIHGWYDLGIHFQLPDLPLVTEAQAELIVVRGDGAASNPLPIKLTPAAPAPNEEEFVPPNPAP